MFLRLALLMLLFHIVSSQSIIKSLPGFAGILPFKLETGYIGVGESEELQLFYYFVESESNPEEDPLLLWLTGGPGCSGISGFLYEIGPLTFNYTNSRKKPALQLNPHSWSKIANIIFLDAPIGVGFSYATTSLKYYSNDTAQGITNYEFLRKWLLDHQEFQSNRVYITGDSYAGKIVPLVVQEIHKGNIEGLDPQVNLQGYAVGNPVIDEPQQENARFEFAYLKGLISKNTYESGKRNCKGNYTYADPNNAACLIALKEFEECSAKLFYAHILEPKCSFQSPKLANLKSDHIDIEDPSASFLALPTSLRTSWCRNNNYILSNKWLNDKTVQNALHVREGIVKHWIRCNLSIWYTRDVPSSYELYRDLVTKGYKALIYSGDHDMDVPYISTLEWIESLNLTMKFDWQPWFVDGQVAGYWMKWIHNPKDDIMTYATVKGAGHTAPEYKPKECLGMISRWLDSFPL